MKSIKQQTLQVIVGIVAISFAGIASAATFTLNPGSFGVSGGAAYNSLNASVDGIGLNITGLNIVDDGAGGIISSSTVTGAGLGVYVSSAGSNLGVLSNLGGDGTNLDGDSGAPSPNDPNEGLLFSFDQQVSLDFIRFDSFTRRSAGSDDFNLTVDGVTLLVDHNVDSSSSPLVTNVLGHFDEYNFNSIIGTNFLFWADGDTDSFTIDAIQVSAVPLPAAAWLFGSALLGMFGFSRRKKA